MHLGVLNRVLRYSTMPGASASASASSTSGRALLFVIACRSRMHHVPGTAGQGMSLKQGRRNEAPSTEYGLYTTSI